MSGSVVIWRLLAQQVTRSLRAHLAVACVEIQKLEQSSTYPLSNPFRGVGLDEECNVCG